MAKKVEGISIEIGLDTTKLKQGLSETEKQMKSEQYQLNKINKSLRFETNPLDALIKKNAQLQKMLPLISKEIEQQRSIVKGLQKDAEKGKAGQAEIDKAKKKLGEMTDQYRLLAKEADYTSDKINKMKWDNLSKVGQALSSVSASIGAVTASIVASETKAADYVNQLYDTASASGLAFEEYQKLAYAMNQVGASSDTMKSAMAKVNSVLGNLATGNGLASAKTLAKLGINYKEFAKLDTKSAFYALVDALKNVKDETERVGLANSIFGEEMGTKLLPVINAGSEALKEYGEQTSVITDEQAAASKTFENMTTNLKAEFAAIGAELLPTMNELLGNLLSLVKEKIAPALKILADRINNLSPSVKNIIAIATTAITALGPLLIIVSKVGKSFSGLGETLSGLGAAGGGKIGLIIAAVAALVAILAKAYKTDEGFRESVNQLGSTLKETLGAILPTIVNLVKSFQPVLEAISKLVVNLAKAVLPVVNSLLSKLAPIVNNVLNLLKPLLDINLTEIYGGVSLISAAIENLIPVMEVIANAVDYIFQFIQPALDWVGKFTSKISNLIGVLTGKNSLKEAANDLYQFLYKTFKPFIDWLSKTWDTIINGINRAANAIGDFFKKMWEGIKDFFSGFGQKFVDFWQSIGNWFTGNGWNTNAELQEQATASSKRMANRQNSTTNNNNSTTNNNNNDNRTYNVTINTSADSMSFDELDRQLGASLA